MPMNTMSTGAEAPVLAVLHLVVAVLAMAPKGMEAVFMAVASAVAAAVAAVVALMGLIMAVVVEALVIIPVTVPQARSVQMAQEEA